MEFLVNETRLIRNGRVVKSKRIEKLEDLYLNKIGSTGFFAIWQKGSGWLR